MTEEQATSTKWLDLVGNPCEDYRQGQRPGARSQGNVMFSWIPRCAKISPKT